MRIAIMASDDQLQEINNGIGDTDFMRIYSFANLPSEVEAYLFLQDTKEGDFEIPVTKPVIINGVCNTLKEMNAAANVVRINGWNSFLSRSIWEVSGLITEPVKKVFAALGKKMIVVPDELGFVSARIVSMIINEAYFALEDKISTREDIDIAMKLGTNYPYGPFEWASLIGVENIYVLLQKLSLHDSRYLPATLLKAATTK